MRVLGSSCLRGRPAVLSPAFRGASRVTIRASSLSAIHRGLRDSKKARPQGFKPGDLDTSATRRPARSTSRSRRDPDWVPPTFKITKGKKDITDQGPQPRSRRSRFRDPTETFGKKSLVYQVKYGPLRDKLAHLAADEPSPSDNSRVSKDDFMRAFNKGDQERERPRRSGDSSAIGHRSRREEFSGVGRTSRRESGRPEPRGRPPAHSDRRDTRDRWTASTRDYLTGKDTQRPRERPLARTDSHDTDSRWTPSIGRRREEQDVPRPREEADGNSNSQRLVSRSPFGSDEPIRIPRVTAASQFLYGRSVVEAALKDSQRKLYHLYIYDGDNRRNLSQDATLERLADRKGVKVTKLDTAGLRMMDKMSEGRPHNGCVLEASPLPQLPLKALGPLSEDPAKPGFGLEVAYQSSEEAQINGTSDFVSIRLPKGRKPFVLLLDGIQDPGNLGAILRTAAFLGVNAVAITNHNSSSLTPVALKASAGASEVLTLFSVNSAIDFLTRSKEAGWLVYAAVPATSRSRGNSHVTFDRVESYDPLAEQPTILVLGSEGEGLTKKIRREADHEVSIPSSSGTLSVVDSLNVSVATGILCSAFLKKQTPPVEIGEVANEDENESSLW